MRTIRVGPVSEGNGETLDSDVHEVNNEIPVDKVDVSSLQRLCSPYVDDILEANSMKRDILCGHVCSVKTAKKLEHEQRHQKQVDQHTSEELSLDRIMYVPSEQLLDTRRNVQEDATSSADSGGEEAVRVRPHLRRGCIV